MASIIKNLSAKVDKNGLSQVMFFVRMGKNGKDFRTKSGVFVPAKFWNEKKKCLTIPQKIDENEKLEAQGMRERLEIVESRTFKLIEIYGEQATKEFIETTLESFKDYDGILTRDVINKMIQAKNQEAEQAKAEAERKEKYIFNYCMAYFEAKKFSKVRERMFEGLFRSMERYEFFRNKIAKRPFTWYIDEVTREDIEGLFAFYANEHLYRTKYEKTFAKHTLIFDRERKTKRKETIEERGENRLIDMRKYTKAFWNWLIKTKRTKNNPFDGVEIGSPKYGTPYFLTIEERNQIAAFDFSGNKHLEVQRDIFVFQCLIGCRVGDLTKLTTKNIVGDMLVYTPHKTKDEGESTTIARVPLHADACALIDKYKGQDKKGRLFPFIADQNYNEAIKAILTACEITREVPVLNPKTREPEMRPINEIASSHMLRRTFAGNAYKLVQDPNVIGKMTGHVEGSKAFARYRDIDDSILKDVVNKLG